MFFFLNEEPWATNHVTKAYLSDLTRNQSFGSDTPLALRVKEMRMSCRGQETGTAEVRRPARIGNRCSFFFGEPFFWAPLQNLERLQEPLKWATHGIRPQGMSPLALALWFWLCILTSLIVVSLKMCSRACYSTCTHLLDSLVSILALKTPFFAF